MNEQQFAIKQYKFAEKQYAKTDGCKGVAYATKYDKKFQSYDFEKLQNEFQKLGYFIKRFCDIKTQSEFYKMGWDDEQNVLIARQCDYID